MNELNIKTKYGTLIINLDCDEMRELKFKNALSVSGMKVQQISYYGLESQGSSIVADFEKYLLHGQHVAKKEDVEKFLSKFQIRMTNDNFWGISFFPSGIDMWFGVASITGLDSRKFFELEIWEENIDNEDCAVWIVDVKNSENILKEAIEFACLVAEKVRLGKLSLFRKKLDLLFERYI